jgi:hypothetical protein
MERYEQIDVKNPIVNVHKCEMCKIQKDNELSCKVNYVCGDGNTVKL